jgi:hypothetical protein
MLAVVDELAQLAKLALRTKVLYKTRLDRAMGPWIWGPIKITQGPICQDIS